MPPARSTEACTRRQAPCAEHAAECVSLLDPEARPHIVLGTIECGGLRALDETIDSGH